MFVPATNKLPTPSINLLATFKVKNTFVHRTNKTFSLVSDSWLVCKMLQLTRCSMWWTTCTGPTWVHSLWHLSLPMRTWSGLTPLSTPMCGETTTLQGSYGVYHQSSGSTSWMSFLKLLKALITRISPTSWSTLTEISSPNLFSTVLMLSQYSPSCRVYFTQSWWLMLSQLLLLSSSTTNLMELTLLESTSRWIPLTSMSIPYLTVCLLPTSRS